jgi:hypothetical protein
MITALPVTVTIIFFKFIFIYNLLSNELGYTLFNDSLRRR